MKEIHYLEQRLKESAKRLALYRKLHRVLRTR